MTNVFTSTVVLVRRFKGLSDVRQKANVRYLTNEVLLVRDRWRESHHRYLRRSSICFVGLASLLMRKQESDCIFNLKADQRARDDVDLSAAQQKASNFNNATLIHVSKVDADHVPQALHLISM